ASSGTARPTRRRARRRPPPAPARRPPPGRTPSPGRGRRRPPGGAPGTASARWVCRAPPPGGRRRAGCPRDVRRRWAARRRPGPRRSRSALVGVVGRVVGQPLAEELLFGQVLLVVRGEAGLAGVEVDGDEVAPVALGRVEHGLDRRDAGGTDRGGRQAG